MRYASGVMALSLCVCSAPVAAATLENVQGVVLAAADAGFQRASNGAALSPGIRLLAKPASSAVIVYEGGCREKIEPGQIVTVKSDLQCVAAIDATQVVLGGAAIAAGVALAVERVRPASP